MNKRKETYEVIENDLPWLFNEFKSIHKHNGKGHILADGKSIRYCLSLHQLDGFLGTYMDKNKLTRGYFCKASISVKDLQGTDFVVFAKPDTNLRMKMKTSDVLARNTENRKDYFTLWFTAKDFTNFSKDEYWNWESAKKLVDKTSEIEAYKREPEPSNKWNNNTSIETTILVDGAPMRFDSKLKCYEYLKKIKQTTHKNYDSWRICFNRKTKGGALYSVTTLKGSACVLSNVLSEVNPYIYINGFFSERTIHSEGTLERTEGSSKNNNELMEPQEMREYRDWCEGVPEEYRWSFEEWRQLNG